MRKLLTTAFAILVAVSLSAQTRLIEKVTKTGDETIIPYSKYELSNGLTLVIHEDHSDPVVHVDITYHVGSAREEVGKSGFAHFFEHMMFQGSDNVADEEHFKIVSEVGGTLNGSTTADRTNYFETLPSNQLETALWLEADRMGFLLDAVTQTKFENQRSTVKNERGQNYDNRPYGTVFERIARAMYPVGHPYSWSTIGDLEDLNRSDVNDLKRFFLRWYGPNNATLTVGGDVNINEVIQLTERYFGSIPRGPEVKPQPYQKITLDQDRYISYTDPNIRFPAMVLAFPSVPNRHPDEAPLDMLSDILGGGKNSIFYKNFVKTQKAVFAAVQNPCSELGGQFLVQVFAMPAPGLSLADLEKEIRASLAEFETRGVTDEDLLRYRNQYESQTINGLTSVSGKVSQLAAFQTFTGSPNGIQSEMKRYASITKEDVMRVYEQYIKGQKGVILSVLTPAMEGMQPAPDNFTFSAAGYVQPIDPAYNGLTYNKPKNESFDRSKRPVAGKAPLVSVPEIWQEKFANGMEVIGTVATEVPIVNITLTLDGGHKLDALNPKKAGLAALTASLMNESTENYTNEQLSVELEKLGSSISIGAGTKSITVSMNSLRKNMDATLNLLEEKLFKPKFSEEDFERVKQQQIEGIKAAAKQPASIASQSFNALIYGEGSIYSVPESGYQETVEAITLADVKAFYKTWFVPNVTDVVVVGDFSQREFNNKAGFLRDWKKKEVKMPVVKVAGKSEKTKVYLMDKPKAPQSEIRIGYLTNLKFDATGDYYRTSLMNYQLGGAFNSRINLNLREDKGWTYGARSYYTADEDPGYFVASAGVRADATDSSVAEFMKEISGYAKTGITAEELVFTKNSIGQSDARKYETPDQKAGFIGRILKYKLNPDYVTKQNQILDGITQKEINSLAKKHLPADKMRIVVVGDKELVKPGLEKLGYQVVEIDERGKVINLKVKKDKSN